MNTSVNINLLSKSLIIVVIGFIMVQLVNLSEPKKDSVFSIFDESEINGKIVEIKRNRKGDNLIVDNDTNLFIFSSYNYGFSKNDFTDLAEKGDTVNKLPKQDYLFLIKNKSGREYKIFFNTERRKSKT